MEVLAPSFSSDLLVLVALPLSLTLGFLAGNFMSLVHLRELV